MFYEFCAFPGRLCYCNWDSCQGKDIVKDFGAVRRKWPSVGYISKRQQKKSNRINIDICDRKQLCSCKVTACPWNDLQSSHEPQSSGSRAQSGRKVCLVWNVCLHVDTQVHCRFTCFSQLWLLRLTYMLGFLSFSLFTVSSRAMDVPEPASLA